MYVYIYIYIEKDKCSSKCYESEGDCIYLFFGGGYTLLPDNGLFQLKRSVSKFLHSVVIDTEYYLICDSKHAV